MRIRGLLSAFIFSLLSSPCLCLGQTQIRVTILYDAFGKPSNLKKDWGYATLVEYGGKQILFDTGNNAEIFAANVKALGLDLRKLDLAVVSHRHADHTSGLNYLLRVNPGLKIFAPREDFGVFGGSVSRGFYRNVESLPALMRYFGGAVPERIPTGSPWPLANFQLVERRTEIAKGVQLVPTISHVPGTMELREISLSLETRGGQALFVGCSHAGIEEILKAATADGKHVDFICGGLHLVKASDSDVERIASHLRWVWKIGRVAVGHCTGEPAFASLQKAFGDDYTYAGLGTVVELR